jgi:hypothetical protein
MTSNDPEDHSTRAESPTPLGSTPPNHGSQKGPVLDTPHKPVKLETTFLSLSKRLGLVLWLLENDKGNQYTLIRKNKFLTNASLQLVLAAEKFKERLCADPDLVRRLQLQIFRLKRPTKNKKVVVHKRFIGVGYKDKGTLAPYSSKARILANQEAYIRPDERGLLACVAKLRRIDEDGWIELSEALKLQTELFYLFS